MSSITGGGATPPAPPPFNPLKISGDTGIAQKALNQDISRYLSYQFPVFPGLATAKQNEINDAYKALTGPLAPELQSDFMNRAAAGAQSVTGGGDLYSGAALRDGSMAKGSESASFTRQDLANQDYNRSRFESLIQQNPVPGLGLSQNDIASMYIYNTGAQNASTFANFTNNINAANASYQNQVNTYNTIGNTISSLGSIYSNYQNNYGYNSSAVPSNYGQGFYG